MQRSAAVGKFQRSTSRKPKRETQKKHAGLATSASYAMAARNWYMILYLLSALVQLK